MKTAAIWAEQLSRDIIVEEIGVKNILYDFVQPQNYVGEVLNINYEEAILQIHDSYRQKVGGIPSLSFLIATRIRGNELELSSDHEDSNVILLRVLDSTALPNEFDKTRVRSELIEMADSKSEHLDELMDIRMRSNFAYTGIKCRIVGTFYLDKINGSYRLQFGSDIANYYPNYGLKVYKPTGKVLERIINFSMDNEMAKVDIGKVRYASTNRTFQGTTDVPVYISPNDLDSQKTAVFGMTRTGKSNTIKILVNSVYGLRFKDLINPIKIGQLIFDPNGEYANSNIQDNGSIRDMYKGFEYGKKSDIQTYGIFKNEKKDPDRKLIKINFYRDEDIQIGKEIINQMLLQETNGQSIYLDNFINIYFSEPDKNDFASYRRYQRKKVAYQALLSKAGYDTGNMQPQMANLFGKEFIDKLSSGIKNYDDLREADQKKADNKIFKYKVAAETLSNNNPQWGQLAEAFEILSDYLENPDSTYSEFNQDYRNKKTNSGENWADEDFRKILTMFCYANGSRLISKARDFHSMSSNYDYAQSIYEDLKNGRTVIIDQSVGEPKVQKVAAERIMWAIFRGNSEFFRKGDEPPKILSYIEEAHNLLPKGSENDNTNIWARVAKEGAKFQIGMVFSTQEVSSIQRSILKNTANWFISHLNNKEEIRELCSYYDFEDFAGSILKAQDKGFLRVKTKSNPFVISVQINKFEPSIK